MKAFESTKTLGRRLLTFLHSHRMLVLLWLLSAVLLFGNLWNHSLWIDEANTATLSTNLLKYGYPKAWDGKNLISPFSDKSLTKHLAWTDHPWLQYYVCAASFAVFSANNFSARFPFALFGLLSIISLYFLALRMTKSEKTAGLASLLMALSVPFLLYSRSCRYFSLLIFFTILTVLAYLKWSEKPNWKRLLLFILSSVLLFHSFYPFWFCLMFAIGLYFFIFESRRQKFLGLLIAGALILILTMPWFIYAQPGGPAGSSITLESYLTYLFIDIWKLNTYIFPFIFLLILWIVVWFLTGVKILKKNKSKVSLGKEHFLSISVLFYILLIGLIPILATQWIIPAIPFAAILTAFFIIKIREYNQWIAIVSLILILFTNIAHIFPYMAVEKSGISPSVLSPVVKTPACDYTAGVPLDHFLYDELELRFYIFDFLYEITHDYDNRMEGIVKYLKAHGQPDDTVLSWWGECGAIMFYTDLKVLYHFFPFITEERIKRILYQPVNSIDWVVPGGIFIPEDPYFDYHDEDYNRVKIDYPNLFFDPDANIDFHKFKTVKKAPSFYILKKK